MPQENGESENRLSLNPNDFPVIQDWKDGQTYKVSDLGNVELTQVSPGEFTVSPENAAEDITEGGKEEVAPAAPAKKPYPNPAVAGMME